jgi:hypothetical protein
MLKDLFGNPIHGKSLHLLRVTSAERHGNAGE